MRILLIHQMFLEEDDPGGSRFNEMTKSWQNQGCEITVLAGMMHYTGSEKRSEYKGKYFVKKNQNNVEVLRCHVSESYNKNFIGRLWGYFSFMFSSMYAGLFKCKKDYDLILVTSPPLFVGISAFVISRFKRIPYLFEVRDLWPESAIDTGVLTSKLIIKISYAVEKFIYKKARLINVLTPAFKKYLIEKKNIDSNKIIFIPNAADFSLSEKILQDFNSLEFRKKLNWENKFVITYVGAHGVANGLDQILEAGKLLSDTNILFVLIGDGMKKKELQNKVEKLNINNVIFLPSVPKVDVFKYILASDMGASVLKNVDTFKTVYSNKTFDYMACKKPILMAIDGVSKDLIEEANCGIYIEPENISDYNIKLRKYIQNLQLTKEQGINGYNFAINNFDRKYLANKYFKLILIISKSE
jgi:glycosyltransferase involved in cell wall biosynthesis